MNYKNIHDSIINNAKVENRSKSTGVYERHHIIMTSIGGPDTDENTVLLTPREHYMVHLLLWKLNPGNKQFRDPIFTFINKGAKNSRVYRTVRIEHIEHMKKYNPSLYLSEEAKESKRMKLREYAKNRPVEHNAAISKANMNNQSRLGAILSDESKNKIAESLKEHFKQNLVSEETREKLRIASTGKKHTDEALNKMKDAAMKRPRWPHPITGELYDAGNLTQKLKKIGWTNEQIIEYKNGVAPTKFAGFAPCHAGNHGKLGGL